MATGWELVELVMEPLEERFGPGPLELVEELVAAALAVEVRRPVSAAVAKMRGGLTRGWAPSSPTEPRGGRASSSAIVSAV